MKIGKRRVYQILLPLLLASCASGFYRCPGSPPPPPPPVTGRSSSGATYTVTLDTVGPPTWIYNVTSTLTTGTGFTSIQIHAPLDIKGDCAFSVLNRTPPTGGSSTSYPATSDLLIKSGAPEGWTAVQISLTCSERTSGTINFVFTESTGATYLLDRIPGPI